MKVKEIMTKDVISVQTHTTVEEIARLLVTYHVGGLPVVDEESRVVGMVDENDLFLKEKGIPFSAVKVPILFQQWVEPEKLDEIYADAHLHTAADIMNKPVTCVSPEDRVNDVAWLMAQNDLKHVPVTQDDILVGIITRIDIIRSLAVNRSAEKDT
jgi:CBS domain-containing protein